MSIPATPLTNEEFRAFVTRSENADKRFELSHLRGVASDYQA
jgi:hypothetical protein